jgi:hypothetical protein
MRPLTQQAAARPTLRRPFAMFSSYDTTIFAPQKYSAMRYRAMGGGIRYVGTFGLAPCVGFVVYNPGTKSGMVCHFDSDGALGGTAHHAPAVADALLAEFIQKAGRIGLRAWIVQGTMDDNSSRTMFGSLFDACENQGISNVELCASSTGDIVLDLQTGSLFDIRYAGASINNQFRMLSLLRRSSRGQIDVFRLQSPLTQAHSYQAP